MAEKTTYSNASSELALYFRLASDHVAREAVKDRPENFLFFKGMYTVLKALEKGFTNGFRAENHGIDKDFVALLGSVPTRFVSPYDPLWDFEKQGKTPYRQPTKPL